MLVFPGERMIRRHLIAVGLSILTLVAPSTSLRAAAPQGPAAIPAELALTRTR
jgi:hypothetical protein